MSEHQGTRLFNDQNNDPNISNASQKVDELKEIVDNNVKLTTMITFVKLSQNLDYIYDTIKDETNICVKLFFDHLISQIKKY